MSCPSVRVGGEMLTTTVDGLWALQVLTGIEVVAPELGLRPHLPSVETIDMALRHPISVELQAAKVITAEGTVDEPVVEWLTVLSRRDGALLLYAQSPANPSQPERVLLARFRQWWVALEHHEEIVRLSGAGIATTERSACELINTEIKRLCGELPPAEVRPVTVDAVQLLTAVRDQASLRHFLLTQRLDPDQCGLLMQASDPKSSAQISIVASPFAAGTVTIIDSPQGRLVSERITRGGKTWIVVSPGSARQINSAVQKLMRCLPAEDAPYSHRKVV